MPGHYNQMGVFVKLKMHAKSAQKVQSYWKMSNMYLGATWNVHTKNGVHTPSGYWEEVDWRRHDDDNADADTDTQAMTLAPWI